MYCNVVRYHRHSRTKKKNVMKDVVKMCPVCVLVVAGGLLASG